MKEKGKRLERLSSIDGLKPVEKPIVLAELGSGHPIVAVISAMHGNEETGVYVVDALRRLIKPEKGTVRLIVANPPALFRDIRFITEDLNRAFPGELGKQGETGLAPQILELVKDSDFTIDLHTTTSPTEGFVIVNNKDKKKIEFAEMTGVNKILLIPRQKKYAMIDFVNCGIGIELGLHNSQYAYNLGRNAMDNVLTALGMTGGKREAQQMQHEYYELIGSVPRPGNANIEIPSYCKNFSLVHKGDFIATMECPQGSIVAEEDFYPVFLGEKAYTTVCLKAKKISREEIMGLIQPKEMP